MFSEASKEPTASMLSPIPNCTCDYHLILSIRLESAGKYNALFNVINPPDCHHCTIIT